MKNAVLVNPKLSVNFKLSEEEGVVVVILPLMLSIPATFSPVVMALTGGWEPPAQISPLVQNQSSLFSIQQQF